MISMHDYSKNVSIIENTGDCVKESVEIVNADYNVLFAE